MKRVLISVLAMVLVLILTACSSGVSQGEYDALAAELEGLKDQLKEQSPSSNKIEVPTAPDVSDSDNEQGAVTTLPPIKPEGLEKKIIEVPPIAPDVSDPDNEQGAVQTLPPIMPEGLEKEIIEVPPIAPGVFDANAVITQLTSTEYTLHTDYLDIAYLVVKNTSPYVLKIKVTAKFYDDSGDIIGSNSQDEMAFEPGYEMAFGFHNEDDFASVEYDYWVEEDNWYKPVLSSLSMEVSTTNDKAIISVTNNGDLPAQFVKFTALFMRGEELVYSDIGYCIDGDSEIKPGKMQRGEAKSYENFDNVLIYLSGRAD